MTATATATSPGRLLAVTVAGALVLVTASVSTLGIALPVVAADLGASQLEVVWIASTTSVVFTAALLPAGAAARRYGRRRVVCTGLAVLAVAEVATGVATSPEQVVALRVASGLGAACVLPSTLTLLVSAVPPSRRPRAVTAWTVLSSVGASGGAVGGGLLLESVSWRVVPAGIGVLAALLLPVLARAVGPDSPDGADGRADGAPPDLLGAVLVFCGLGATVYAVSAIGDRGITSPSVLAPLGVGLALLVAFARRQRSAPAPLLPTAELRRPQLRAGAVLLLGTAAAFSAFTFAGPQYFQLVQGFSPLQTSLLFLTTDAGLLAASPFVPGLVARLGAVRLGALGAAATAAALVGLAALASPAPQPTPGATYAALVLLGVGSGVTLAAAADLVVSPLPEDRRPLGSSLTYLARDTGAALGGAVVGAVLLSTYRAALPAATADVDPALAATADEGLAAAVAVAADLGDDGAGLLEGAAAAFGTAYQAGLLAAAGTSVAALLVLLVDRRAGAAGRRAGRPAARPLGGAAAGRPGRV